MIWSLAKSKLSERKQKENLNKTEERREGDRLRKEQAREKETVEETEERREGDRLRKEQAREKETVEETEERREGDRLRKEQAKEKEAPEETEERREGNRLTKKQARKKETLEETKKRRKGDMLRVKETRNKETPEERAERQRKDREFQSKMYALSKVHQSWQYEQTDLDKFTDDTAVIRRKKFQDKVFIGPIYVCSCCSRMLYNNSVSQVTNHLKTKIQEKLEELITCLKGYQSPDTKVYICHTCKIALSAGRMPALAVENGLDITDLEPKFKLTELENNLIAQNINFQKMILLPKSRWAAGKGRMVSVPVGAQDVMNTMKQIPRLPEEAGLIPIKLKRKKKYQGHEKNELVRPEKLFLVLKKLKELGHPYYQNYDTQEEYEARSRESEKRNKTLLSREHDKDDVEERMNPMQTLEHDNEEGDEVLEGGNNEDLEEELAKEEEDLKNDPVRKQHFNYSANSVLVNGHPEIMLDGDGNQIADLNFAPAEGKVPENFLNQKCWDIKSWPTLHPDGKFGMDHQRKIKLTKQNYFVQRILNKNTKFANTPGYVFGATSYVESERLRNNANLSGYGGKKDTDGEGQVSYSLTNPFTVFDKVPNTPKYWQNVRFEMMAKMENMGPFHWFFTLSCGDMRWCANFQKYFEEKKYELHVDNQGLVWVRGEIQKGKKLRKGWEKDFSEKREPIMKRTWDDLKESEEFKTEVSTHEEIRNDVLLATRNFQHRVEMFRKEIMFGSNNPMKIRHITYRVEFQGRGAGHIHGVLWVDLEEINKEMKQELEREINKVEIDMLTEGKHEEKVNKETVLVDAYDNLRRNEKLKMAEVRALELFADKFCTCSLNSNEVGEKVAKIAKLVNEHGHSKSCKKNTPKCRWRYPKFPLPKTSFIDANREIPEEEKLDTEYIESTLKRVKNVLIEDNNGKEQISQKVHDIMDELPWENGHTIKERILRILDEASKDGEGQIELTLYIRAVEQKPDKSQRCKILLRRDINEIFINNYNPEWLEAWDSNIDVSLVSDFYGAITYITDYWTKDSSGLTDVLTSAVKQLSKDDEMKKKCQELANTFISHRQIGEAEAYYKLFPHMNLTYSSVATTYIPTDSIAEKEEVSSKAGSQGRKRIHCKR